MGKLHPLARPPTGAENPQSYLGMEELRSHQIHQVAQEWRCQLVMVTVLEATVVTKSYQIVLNRCFCIFSGPVGQFLDTLKMIFIRYDCSLESRPTGIFILLEVEPRATSLKSKKRS